MHIVFGVGISYLPPSELVYHYNQKLYVDNQMLYLGDKRLENRIRVI